MLQIIQDVQTKLANLSGQFALEQKAAKDERDANAAERAQSQTFRTQVGTLVQTADTLKKLVNDLIAAQQNAPGPLAADELATLAAANAALDSQTSATKDAIVAMNADTAAANAETAALSADTDKVSQANTLDASQN